MASYTGLSNLQNNVHRSGFDLSQRKEFSAKVGELLPVYWNLALPSEKYRFKISYFTRTQPLQTSAYTRIREYFDIFEVPLNLLWKSSLSAITQMGEKNPIEALSLNQNLLVNTGLPSLSLGNLSDMLLYMNGKNHFLSLNYNFHLVFCYFHLVLLFLFPLYYHKHHKTLQFLITVPHNVCISFVLSLLIFIYILYLHFAKNPD